MTTDLPAIVAELRALFIVALMTTKPKPRKPRRVREIEALIAPYQGCGLTNENVVVIKVGALRYLLDQLAKEKGWK